MAWLRHSRIAVFALASLAALGCEAEIGGQPVSTTAGGTGGGTAGASPVAPGASRFLQDAQARPTPLRRLTRAEYGNIVQQLLGVTAPAVTLLPDDSLSSGFTSTVG